MIYRLKKDDRLVNNGNWNQAKISPCGTGLHFPEVFASVLDGKVFCTSCGESHCVSEFKRAAVRWVDESKWFNPFTRNSGYYEAKIHEEKI